MSFRKNTILFFEQQILLGLFALLSLFLIPYLGEPFPILLAGVFCALIIANTRIQNEYVTINERGISCNKSGVVQWQYQWSEIAGFQRSSRLRLPSVEILIPSTDSSKQNQLSGNYFQLCPTATKALKQYYCPNENKDF